MKSKKSLLFIVNILVLAAMVVYLIVRMIQFNTNGLINSAPTTVILFESVYFLVPLALFDLVFYLVGNKKPSNT